ncbi:MAG: LacI family DNA-binding transcriptional regulator [Victivallales bacterium]
MSGTEKNKAVSRSDVARAAGVSGTTVTHALNPPPGVRMNVKTRERVCRIAHEMGYRPNFFGRSLVTGKSFAVGLLQPEYEALFLGFYQHMAYGLASSMAADDYNILMAFKDERRNYLKLVNQGRVDGMVVLQSKAVSDNFREIAATGVPTLILNQPYDCAGLESCANVCSDHEGLVADIMKSFRKRGRKSILSVNDYDFCVPNFCVFDAFRKSAAKFSGDGVGLVSLSPLRDDFERQIRNLFDSGQRFDGIYIDGEEFAETYVGVAREYGMECGQDYDLHVSSVVPELSADDFDFPVDVYVQQGEKMGVEAWKTMKKMINGKEFCIQTRIPYIKKSKR